MSISPFMVFLDPPYTHAEARFFALFASRITSPRRIAATAPSAGLKLVTADRRMAALQAALSEIPDIPALTVEVIQP